LDIERATGDLLSDLAEPLNAAHRGAVAALRCGGTTWLKEFLFSFRRAATIKRQRAKAGSSSAAPSAAKPFAVGVIAHLKNRPHRQLEKQVRQGQRETPPAMRRVNTAVSGLLLV
jgi:hypothetical protein